MVRGGDDRTDRALRLSRRRRWRCDAAGQSRRRGQSGRQLGKALPRPLLPRSAARRTCRRRRAHGLHRAPRLRPGSPGRRHAPRTVPHPRRLPRARGAGVHRRGLHARRYSAAQALYPRAAFRHAAGDGRALRRSSGRACELGSNRAALQSGDSARQELPARLSDPCRTHDRATSAQRGDCRTGEAPRGALSRGPRARCEASGIPRAAGVRSQDHHPDGLRRVLPDRRRLHQLGQAERGAGRPGPRVGRGIADRLRARHYRSRPAALHAALRAVPEPRAGVDARLRHRLLPGRPRQGDRVREEEIRRRVGVADRDLWHDGGQWCATWAACSICRTASATVSPS